jgi:hypothetical protein
MIARQVFGKVQLDPIEVELEIGLEVEVEVEVEDSKPCLLHI